MGDHKHPLCGKGHSLTDPTNLVRNGEFTQCKTCHVATGRRHRLKRRFQRLDKLLTGLGISLTKEQTMSLLPHIILRAPKGSR